MQDYRPSGEEGKRRVEDGANRRVHASTIPLTAAFLTLPRQANSCIAASHGRRREFRARSSATNLPFSKSVPARRGRHGTIGSRSHQPIERDSQPHSDTVTNPVHPSHSRGRQ